MAIYQCTICGAIFDEEKEGRTLAELTECPVCKQPISKFKRIDSDEQPQEPVMPGVLIVEALAQTGAVAILSLPENKGKTAYFAAINSAKFKKKVIPGDVLMLETEIIKVKGPMGIGKATATVDGKVAVQAELTFAIS